MRASRWVCVGIIGLLVLAACGGDKEEPQSGSGPAAAEASLSTVAERVEWQGGGADSFLTVTGTQIVATGDEIRTDATGQAVLTFFTGTEVTIQPGTDLTVTAFEPTGQGGSVITLEQSVGETLHSVELVADSQSRYELVTPTAQLIVRGTAFSVQVAEDGTTDVAVTQGVVQATVGTQTYDINPGEGISIAPDETTTGPFEIDPIRPPDLTPSVTPTERPAVTAQPTSTRPAAERGATSTPLPTPSLPAMAPPSPR